MKFVEKAENLLLLKNYFIFLKKKNINFNKFIDPSIKKIKFDAIIKINIGMKLIQSKI